MICLEAAAHFVVFFSDRAELWKHSLSSEPPNASASIHQLNRWWSRVTMMDAPPAVTDQNAILSLMPLLCLWAVICHPVCCEASSFLPMDKEKLKVYVWKPFLFGLNQRSDLPLGRWARGGQQLRCDSLEQFGVWTDTSAAAFSHTAELWVVHTWWHFLCLFLAGLQPAGALQLRDQEGAGEMHGDDGVARFQLWIRSVYFIFTLRLKFLPVYVCNNDQMIQFKQEMT